MSPYHEQLRDRAAAEYIHEVERRGDSAWLYVNAVTPVPVTCGKCGREWTPRPDNYKAGKGCPHCAPNNPDRSRKAFEQAVRDRGDVQVGEYVHNVHPVGIVCGNCGDRREVLPERYKLGLHLCPCERASGGFDPDRPAYVYLVVHPDARALKVGITNHVEQRLSTHRRHGYDVLRVVHHPDGHRVRELERDVIRALNALGLKPVPDAPEDGRTETVPLEALDVALTVFKIAVHDAEQSGGGDVTDQFV